MDSPVTGQMDFREVLLSVNGLSIPIYYLFLRAGWASKRKIVLYVLTSVPCLSQWIFPH